MSVVATLNGARLVTGRLYLPAWGIPWAEANLDEEITMMGPAALVMADLTFIGTIMSGGKGPTGRSSYCLAGGAGGWGNEIAARGYANDAGVKASTVLTDAAIACGEILDPLTLPSTRLGPAWTREAAPASRSLESIAPAEWYVGIDGITRIGRRLPIPHAIPTAITSIDRARGLLTLATEAILTLQPGAIVEGLQAVDVLHEVSTGAKLRTTIWGAGIASTTRRLAAWRRILEALDPDRRFAGVYEYRIVSQDGERLNLQPIRVSIGMPELQRVPVSPGIAGARANHLIGARVLVAFIDASQARPVVIGFEDAEGAGFVPIKTELKATAEINLANGILGVARLTDPVVAGPWAGTITGASVKVRAG